MSAGEKVLRDGPVLRFTIFRSRATIPTAGRGEVSLEEPRLLKPCSLGDKTMRRGQNRGIDDAPSVGLPTCAIIGSTGLKNPADILASEKEIKMGDSFF